ncbi:MAG: thiol-disulfide oxidoreductase, partial [Methyloprofundus sp.]|nr:thiol-disulfide oxidoreductase [Methyloprofundus sp.]
MLSILSHAFARYHQRQAPAFIIGIFRVLYGIVAFQEIVFLLYFNHLIFDPVPYIDVEFPMIPLFLCLWAVVASWLIV